MREESPIAWEHWSAPVHATLLFVIREGKILLIEKKRGHGAGKINGPGGKMDPGETPYQCAVRETEEELRIRVTDAKKVGELHFSMSDVPDILCHVYAGSVFIGHPEETDEAVPCWYEVTEIPYERMWRDDRYWIPMMLNKESFLGRFVFEDEELKWMSLESVSSFDDELEGSA